MRKITAIQADTRTPRYVQSTFRRSDRTIGVELTDNKNLAHDFGGKESARQVIDKVFNPYERKYTAVELEVSQPSQIGTVLESLKLS